MKNIILCDIDGTVANNDHRQHFLEGKKDWDGFFSELSNDIPIYSIIEKIKNHQSEGKDIIFLTGRPERHREETESWLKRYFNFKFQLLMRKDNDLRNKVIAKEELLKENSIQSGSIHLVYENDEDLINYWITKEVQVYKVKN
jgi:acid phosphatase class B